MAIYSFSTNLLSAAKTGNPNLTGTTLSAIGVSYLSGANVVFATQQVVVASLSTNDVGLAFTPVNYTPAVTSLSTFSLTAYPVVSVNVSGSVFTIPRPLTGSTFAVVKTNGTFTTFPWLSSTTTVPTSAITVDDVSTPNTRRLRILGYK